jgi:hypothetical protein
MIITAHIFHHHRTSQHAARHLPARHLTALTHRALVTTLTEPLFLDRGHAECLAQSLGHPECARIGWISFLLVCGGFMPFKLREFS